MLMKVFPHGTGEGDKPSRYLVRPDYPGRDTAPQVLRGDLVMTRALIDSIERRWKFTSGALPWHPDEKISEAQEEEVMDAFERVAFAGLEAEGGKQISEAADAPAYPRGRRANHPAGRHRRNLRFRILAAALFRRQIHHRQNGQIDPPGTAAALGGRSSIISTWCSGQNYGHSRGTGRRSAGNPESY